MSKKESDWKLRNMVYHIHVDYLTLGDEHPISQRVVQMSSRQLVCTVRTASCTTDTMVEIPEEMDPKTQVMRPWSPNRVYIYGSHRKRHEWNMLLSALSEAVMTNNLQAANVVMGDLADLMICRAPDRVLGPLPASVITMIKREAMQPGWSCGAVEAVLPSVSCAACDGSPAMVRLLHSWDPISTDKAWEMVHNGFYITNLSTRDPANWRLWYPGYYISAAVVDAAGLDLDLPRKPFLRWC